MQKSIDPNKVGYYQGRIQGGQKIDPIEIKIIPGEGRFIDNGHHRFVAYMKEGYAIKDIPMVEDYADLNYVGYPDWSKTAYKDLGLGVK